MKVRQIVLMIVFLLTINYAVLAERQLERAEILQVFQQLTSQSKTAWIPAGTIEATHEEYRAPKITDVTMIENQIDQQVSDYQSNSDKAELTADMRKLKLDAIPFNVRYELSNEYTMTSTATVRSNGEKFYWEINVDSRSDSVKPGTDLAGNFMTEEFNMDWNGKRIFAWDGQKYTIYAHASNHAIIDATGGTLRVVNGPLTAGVTRWGNGFYSYSNLIDIDSSAVEKIVDGQVQIHLSLNDPGNRQMAFVMDPAKNYAVLSCSLETAEAVISKQYADFRLVADQWVPTVIMLEKFEAGTNRLLARDLWDITAIDGNVPGAQSFEIDYEDDTLMEYSSAVTDKPAMYRYSNAIDTELLLAERLTYAANEGIQSQNCATAALKYAAGQLGKDFSAEQLAQLITAPDNETSLLEMKQFAESQGLYCRAVTTDIDSLRGLQDCQIILHIPGKKHFVVLESIDDAYMRIIDLTDDKFYYRTDISFFGMDWPEGTALLVSNNPVTGGLDDLDNEQLAGLQGAEYYECNTLRQEYNVIFCVDVGAGCEGQYMIFFQRWGCGTATSGSCSQSTMIRYAKCACIEDPYDPEACMGNGDWTIYNMQACA